ncbi:MAG: hypothetical protein PHN57_02965 [Candidatus Omnitrophica bacterium]|nr:hypothetical protein [Candidatus Omnitrophota bacterium]
MIKKINASLILILSVVFLYAGFSAAEEQNKPQGQEQISSEPEVQWLWGDVISVDSANKKVTVKYLDYETDSEKEISIAVSDTTTFENVKSLEDIKPQDTVSIDYVINPDGSNTAKNISVEKIEGSELIQPENTDKDKDMNQPPKAK